MKGGREGGEGGGRGREGGEEHVEIKDVKGGGRREVGGGRVWREGMEEGGKEVGKG